MLAQSAYACSPVRPCRRAGRRACTLATPINPKINTHLVGPCHSLRAGADLPSCANRDSNQDVSRRQHLAFAAAAAILGLSPLKSSAEQEPASPAARALDAIRRDFVDRQYYVTGDLSPQLFAPDCLFKDPTVEVVGVEPYVRALQTLFDPSNSRADLISIRTAGPNTVELRWRLEGSLKIAGLKIKPYTGTTMYTISENGKVTRHEETWDISTVDAFVSTFFPGFGAPPAPPVSPAAQ